MKVFSMKKIIFTLAFLFMMSSCVSSKMFNEIEERYANLKGDHVQLETEHGQLLKNYDSLRYHYGELVKQYE